jgi:hypothetical protein
MCNEKCNCIAELGNKIDEISNKLSGSLGVRVSFPTKTTQSDISIIGGSTTVDATGVVIGSIPMGSPAGGQIGLLLIVRLDGTNNIGIVHPNDCKFL